MTPWNCWPSLGKVAAELYSPQRTLPLLLCRPLIGTLMVLPCCASATAPATPETRPNATANLLRFIALPPKSFTAVTVRYGPGWTYPESAADCRNHRGCKGL